jgi:hypothetical protein
LTGDTSAPDKRAFLFYAGAGFRAFKKPYFINERRKAGIKDFIFAEGNLSLFSKRRRK